MRIFFKHFKTYFIRGLLAIIPLMLTLAAIYFLYNAVDRRSMAIVERYLGVRIPGLGFVLVICIIYLIGLAVSNVVGKKLLQIVEKITQRIPLVKTTYSVGKQLATTLSLPEKQAFKKAVMVEFLKPGMWTIGFVTGTIMDTKKKGERLLKVYIPTPPNPTSGTIVIVRESETRDPGWTVREALNTVISGGILGPEKIK